MTRYQALKSDRRSLRKLLFHRKIVPKVSSQLNYTATLSTMATTEESQDLSFDEIDSLLRRAEQRLKDAQQLTSTAKNLGIPTLPKLQSGKIAKPYVQSSHGVARTEGRSTISESQRMLSEQPRKIQDPVEVKQQKKQKGTFHNSLILHLPQR